MRLSLGTGPLPRLLAPGVPDWIGADGARVWWTVRDALFLLDGDGVRTTLLPDEGMESVVSAAGCTCGTAYGAVVVGQDGEVSRTLTVDAGEPLGVLPGADCVLVLSVPSHSLVPLAGGAPLPLPDAATRARFAAPFAVGVGLVWLDLESLYRLGADGRPHALGRASGANALAVGPFGATLVALEDDTLCVAPGAPVRRLGEPVEVPYARFSPDGLRALAADDDGLQEIDLRTGRTLRRWPGPLTPVGYAPEATWIDGATGELRTADGRTLLTGFAGGAAATGGDWLVGPGTSAWSISTGACLRKGLPSGVSATDGTRIVVANDSDITVVDGAQFAHGLGGGHDDGVELVALSGEEVAVQSECGALVVFTLTGELVRRAESAPWLPEPDGDVDASLSEPGEPSEVVVGGQRWALPVDGVLRAAGQHWAWSVDGALYALS